MTLLTEISFLVWSWSIFGRSLFGSPTLWYIFKEHNAAVSFIQQIICEVNTVFSNLNTLSEIPLTVFVFNV